jgi:hypothetical protein
MSGDSAYNTSPNHFWIFSLLRQLAQVTIFILHTDALSPLPDLTALVNLVLELSPRKDEFEVCDLCHERAARFADDKFYYSNTLGSMPNLQSLNLMWSSRRGGWCTDNHFDFGSLKHLRHLALDHVAPKHHRWSVPTNCELTLDGSSRMLMDSYVDFFDRLHGWDMPEDVQRPPPFIRRVSHQLTALRVTLPVLDGCAGAASWQTESVMEVLSGSFPALRELKISSKGSVGSSEAPLALGAEFRSLVSLHVIADGDIHLFCAAEIQPRVANIQSAAGVLDVRMADVESFVKYMEQLCVKYRQVWPESSLAACVDCMAAKGLEQQSPEHECVTSLWCPPYNEQRVQDLLCCACGACMACLRRSGALVL